MTDQFSNKISNTERTNVAYILKHQNPTRLALKTIFYENLMSASDTIVKKACYSSSLYGYSSGTCFRSFTCISNASSPLSISRIHVISVFIETWRLGEKHDVIWCIKNQWHRNLSICSFDSRVRLWGATISQY